MKLCSIHVSIPLNHSINYNTNNYRVVTRLDNKNPDPVYTENLYTTIICLGPVACTCLDMVPPESTIEVYQSNFTAYISQLDNQMGNIFS